MRIESADYERPTRWAVQASLVLATVAFLGVQWWAQKGADGGGIFIQRMLPRSGSLFGTILTGSAPIMDFPEEAF